MSLLKLTFCFIAVKQKKKNLKAAHKSGKQKKMKRKWPGTADKGSSASLSNSGSQEQVQGPFYLIFSDKPQSEGYQ